MQTGSNDSNEVRLFTLRDAAQALSVSYWALIDWQRQGKLATVKLGRLVRVPLSEIQRIEREGIR